MLTPHAFRRRLYQRILAVVVMLPVGAMITPGCLYGSCSDELRSENRCFDWPGEAGAGGMAGSAGAAGMGGAGGSGGMGGGAPTMCPSREEAKPLIEAHHFTQVTVESDGVLGNGQCCYDIQYVSPCIGGRPFLVEEKPRTAPAETRAHGTAWNDTRMPIPEVDALMVEERAELAAAWARDGLFEHASVASFGRFALELMAVGAPADLISAAHEAALDEVRHAKLCLSLASAYAGHVIEPGAFPFDGRVVVSSDLADLASRVAREGAVGETIAAVVADEQLACAEDAAVRAALAVIAEDEARHAELAFRTLVWAIRVGGAPVAEAVANTFVQALRRIDLPPSTRASLSAHGRLDEGALRRAVQRAIDEVLNPAIEALGLRDSSAAGQLTHAYACAMHS